MTSSILSFVKRPVVAFISLCALSIFSVASAFAAKQEAYDIIYIRSNDLEKVLDYKQDLEPVFDANVTKKLKIAGRGHEYALIYDGNLSPRTVTKTLVSHAQLLSDAGFDEPYAIEENKFDPLFNVSYGIGPNLESLKEKYQVLQAYLGEDVKRDLFIEQTDSDNYVIVYRFRGDEASTTRVAKQHATLLKAKKITTSLTRENNNTVVYGESSQIDDGEVNKSAVCQDPIASTNKRVAQKNPTAVQKHNEPSEQKKNINLQRAVEERIANLKNKGVIDGDEITGWMVYDLERDRSIIGINADLEFQAASMIKPFVALAFFHLVNEKKLRYDSVARGKMEAMIQRSSNPATNWAMKQVGGPAQCNAILKRYYGNILKKTVIKEYIPAGGRTYLNSAPPSDYVRFLRALWNQELPFGKEIQRLMALPKRGRLYHGTTIPKSTLVYNKTGSTARLCGDMGILVPKTQKGVRYPYVMVGIIERKSKASNYGEWMHSRGRVIREISSLVYEEMKKENQLM